MSRLFLLLQLDRQQLDLSVLSHCQGLDLDIIHSHPGNWNPENFSKVVPLSDILLHPDYRWSWKDVSGRNDITPEIIELFPSLPWDFGELAYNRKFPWSWISNRLSEKWNWDGLSSIIDFSIIRANPHLPWTPLITANWSVTFQDIQENPTLPWDLSYFYYNKNCHFKDNWQALTCVFRPITELLEHPDEISWPELTCHPQLTKEIVKAYPKKNWIRGSLSSHQNISPQFIIENPELDWSISGLCLNPNLTLKFVCEHPNLRLYNVLEHQYTGWDWTLLTINFCHPQGAEMKGKRRKQHFDKLAAKAFLNS